MRGFLSLFTDSARELKQVRALTVTALLMALGIVLRSLSIPIGTDIRITFSFWESLQLPCCTAQLFP